MRFTISQLLMAVALIGIAILFLQSEGCGSTGHRITHIEFSPDGSELGVVHYSYRGANVPGKVYAADLTRVVELVSIGSGHIETLDVCRLPGNQGPFRTIVNGPEIGFSASRDCVAVVLQDLTTVRLFDLQTVSQTDLRPQIKEPLSGLRFSPEGAMLVLGEGFQALSKWNAANLHRSSPRVIHNVHYYQRYRPSGMSVGPGAKVAVLCDAYQASLVDFSTGKESKLRIRSEDISFATINADGESILSATKTGFFLYDIAARQWKMLEPDSRNLVCLAASPGLTQVLVRDQKPSVNLVPVRGTNLKSKALRDGSSTAAAFSQDGTLVAFNVHSQIEVWDTTTGRLRGTLTMKPRHRFPWTIPLTALVVWLLIVFWWTRSHSKASGRNPNPRSPEAV